MKTNLYVEYQDRKVNTKSLSERVKEIWKEQGGKVKDLETLDIYYKPEENMCYYVINEDIKGSFAF